GHAVRLDLRHVVEDARARRAEYRGIEPREVVGRDDDPAVEREAVATVDAEARGEGGRSADCRPAERPGHVGHAHRAASTSRAIRSMTSSRLSSVVSTS